MRCEDCDYLEEFGAYELCDTCADRRDYGDKDDYEVPTYTMEK